MDKDQINSILSQIGAAPQKDLGQNFLTDLQVLETIVSTASLEKSANVLEVGPGLGILTQKLLAQNHKVLAVEKDPKFYQYLKNRFNPKLADSSLTLLKEDILKINLPEALKIFKKKPVSPLIYQIVANLPYSISTPFLHLIFETPLPPQNATLLLQKEVAQKACAEPPKANPLSLLIKAFSQPSIIAIIPPQAFYPAPKVESAILSLRNIRPPQTTAALQEKKQLFRLIKAGFATPRKTLTNNLENLPFLDKEKVQNSLKKAALSPQVRAQELTLEDWKKLNLTLSP